MTEPAFDFDDFAAAWGSDPMPTVHVDKGVDEDGQPVTQIDMKSLFRKMIYDTGSEHPECVAKVLGLPAVSQDGFEVEIENSNARRRAVLPLAPLLEEFSVLLTSTIIAEHYNFGHMDPDNPDTSKVQLELTKRFARAYHNTISVSAVTLLALLADQGLITINVGAGTGTEIRLEQGDSET